MELVLIKSINKICEIQILRCNFVDKDLVILNFLYHQEIPHFHALIGE